MKIPNDIDVNLCFLDGTEEVHFKGFSSVQEADAFIKAVSNKLKGANRYNGKGFITRDNLTWELNARYYLYRESYMDSLTEGSADE